MIPCDNGSLRIHAGALINDEREAVVLPGHFVLARELDAHRFAGCLRQQRGIIRNRIGAIDSVAAGTHFENDANVFRPQAEHHRDDILLHDNLHNAGHTLNGFFVHAEQRCPHRRWPDDLTVQHTGHTHVVDVLELAGRHRRYFYAWYRFSKDGPFAWVLSFRVGIESNSKSPSTD